jgi:hypothetical protein
MQVMVKHSQDKGEFLKVAIKQMAETQSFEDELKGVNELNLVLLTGNQELIDQLAAESQVKMVRLPDLLISIIDSCPSNSGLTTIMFCRVLGSSCGPRHHPWCSGLSYQSLHRPKSGSR